MRGLTASSGRNYAHTQAIIFRAGYGSGPGPGLGSGSGFHHVRPTPLADTCISRIFQMKKDLLLLRNITLFQPLEVRADPNPTINACTIAVGPLCTPKDGVTIPLDLVV